MARRRVLTNETDQRLGAGKGSIFGTQTEQSLRGSAGERVLVRVRFQRGSLLLAVSQRLWKRIRRRSQA